MVTNHLHPVGWSSKQLMAASWLQHSGLLGFQSTCSSFRCRYMTPIVGILGFPTKKHKACFGSTPHPGCNRSKWVGLDWDPWSPDQNVSCRHPGGDGWCQHPGARGGNLQEFFVSGSKKGRKNWNFPYWKHKNRGVTPKTPMLVVRKTPENIRMFC